MTSIERHEARYQRRAAKRKQKKAELAAQYADFDNVFTFDHLYRSYKKCCEGVAWKASTQKYKANAIFNVAQTYNQLQEGRYKSKGFNTFNVIERGKLRNIKSVHISERVVQRCLCDYCLVPMLTRTFIHDNGACMVGKGIDFALNRLDLHLRQFYRQHGTDGYVLVFDFSKFFDRIRHEVLKKIIAKEVVDPKILWLVFYFIDAFGEVGLGLGSQISQVCALAYPNRLDHYIKEQLHIRFYGRYMDDGYLIHHSKEYLEECLLHIRSICAELGIVINEKKTQIIKLSRGVVFLKTHFYLTASGKVLRLPARKGITTMRRKLKIFHRWWLEGKLTLKDVKTSLDSRKGHLKRMNAHRTVRSMDQLYNKLFLTQEAL